MGDGDGILIGHIVSLRFIEEPNDLLRAIECWYFDHYTLLPLFGEARNLKHLAALDWNMGIRETIRISLYSNHQVEAIKALRNLTQEDPYGVQSYIIEIKDEEDNNVQSKILNYVFHKQSEKIIHSRLIYENLSLIGSGNEVFTELNAVVEEMQLGKQLADGNLFRYDNELITLYNELKRALSWSNVHQIADFSPPILPSKEAPFLFSQSLVEMLDEMNELTKLMKTYNQSTSSVNQLETLEVAIKHTLKLLDKLTNFTVIPAKPILLSITLHWQQLLTSKRNELSQILTAGPINNPYVIANPVTQELFAGREDIIKRLKSLWDGEGQKPSVVVYGHRRMGKTSILQNLKGQFGLHKIIIDFNMQGQVLTADTSELLYNLALEMYDEFMKRSPHADLVEPTEEQFSHHPANAFKRFLKQLDAVRGELRFIVTVDEFELVEQMIREGKVEAGLLDFWRSLIQSYPWFVMALAGLHTLQEMTANYWHPLYASVIAIQVSFLRPKAARRLITQPSPDFPIDYDQDAIETIIALTNGQPYLAQLICHGLVTRFNRQMFEEGVEREHRFSLNDVQAVIQAPDFFRDGNAYFTGVWIQAKESDPPTQITVLQALAPSETGLSLDKLIQKTELSGEEVKYALESLKRHDVVKEEDGRWRFTVELMRRWMAQKS